ncbi:MAG: ABC transporter ATP-binding protein [Elusimicrobiota bacterium]
MIFSKLLFYLKKTWIRSLVAFICMALVAVLSTGTMWVLKYIIDRAMVEKDFFALQNAVWLILISISLKSILWYSHTYLSSYAAHSASRNIRDDVYKHLYSLSMGFFNAKTSGGILSRLTNDVTIMQTALSNGPTVVIRDGLTVLGLIGYLFYSNWKFSLMCFSVLPVVGIVLTKLGKKSRKAGREGQERMASLYETIHEALAAMPVVKVFQAEKREMDDFSKENRNYFNVIMKLVRIEARSSPIMEVLGALVLALMLLIGGKDVINGDWSLGSFVSFVGAAMSLYNPLKKFANVNVQIQQGISAAERVFNLMDQKGTVQDKPHALELKPISRDIEFNNVSFSYPTSDHVLSQINLKINKGEVIALVGPSGSGKSTIAQLLLRFYDPIAGSISIDGNDLRDVSLQSLRKQIAVVTQETHLFNESIKTNISYGKPDATQDEIEQAAKAAYAHDFIVKLPHGYDTIIGERGSRISGGERQRISIARSILKNPAILVLDEATSALDAISEEAVQKALDHLLNGRTVLMIAHRFSTIKKAHRILVLDKGQIVETGSHEKLIQTPGIYQKLFDLQALI